jgi:hypothetical protein|tara:strand:- start:486 stop:629 length:144 start_codon:yes stop_codon:yes gene_type:complete
MEQKENKNNSMQDYEDIYQKEKMCRDKAGYNESLQPKTNKEIFNIDK